MECPSEQQLSVADNLVTLKVGIQFLPGAVFLAYYYHNYIL